MNNERQHPISVLCVDVDNAGTRSFELSAMVHASLTLCGKAKKLSSMECNLDVV